MKNELYVTTLRLDGSIQQDNSYIKNLPLVRNLNDIEKLRFNKPVTFFVGENGTGKSTLLEAVAVASGFNPEGGTVDFNFSSHASHSELHRYLRVGKSAKRPKDGFFLRAESFYNVATQVDEYGVTGYYGGLSLHDQSHGESFMALVLNRFGGNGLYILDEPEAALSPSRQMALLLAIDQLVKNNSQFIIATHSPILMACPNAEIYVLGEDAISQTPYEQTEHYIITKRFINQPQKVIRDLLREE